MLKKTMMLTTQFPTKFCTQYKTVACFLVLLSSLALLMTCKKNNSTWSQLTLEFKSTVNNELIQNGKVYSNVHAESFTITKLKFYTSNFLLQKTDGTTVPLSPTYFLYDAFAATNRITLSVPTGNYSSLIFLLGVDSLRNVSGIQTEALDPANNMFWTWNTGYIMAKLEGSSPIANTAANAITYHIGGFSGTQNATRTVKLSISNINNFTDQKKYNATLTADIGKWFGGVHNIKIADQPYIMSAGGIAMQMADNYAKMFSISNVNEE
jgi:hypothetical protein